MSKYTSWGLAALTYVSVACTGNGGKNIATTSADSFAVDSIVIEDSIPPFINKPEVHPYHQFKLKYLHLKNNTALQSEINRVILNGKIDSISGLSPQDIGKKLYDKIKKEYQNEADGELEQFASMGGWSYHLQVLMVENSRRYLSLQWIEDTYTGGLHGYEAVIYSSFDKERNQRITESDIFVEGYKEPLARIIQAKLAADLELGSVEKLSEYGFYAPQEIEPNGNFMLTEAGVRYCYNPSDIGPYSLGRPEVHLSWESVRELIRPGSIAEQYIK